MQRCTLPILPFIRLEIQESAVAKPRLCALLLSVSPVFTKELFFSLKPPGPPTTSFTAITIIDGLPPPVTTKHD
ncbi:hypothetical protein SADUNF_Sadunf08G0101900 [Salix dunnii]|uniref:Uncharacterized protein n=1 Tax=Salix dunnii TaxID=1413687 RepID=A0A835JWE6_9ROSI|nr:hypothetical protein SADUNF_Sadunf08G0101900 [Salix dunnii]